MDEKGDFCYTREKHFHLTPTPMINRLFAALWGFAASLSLGLLATSMKSTSLSAQVYNGCGLNCGINQAGTVNGPIKAGIDVAVVGVINNLLTYIALIAVIAIIVAGLYMLLSGGSQKDKAKEIIIWTIVGLAVILLAKVIVGTVYEILGAQLPGNVNAIGGTVIRARSVTETVVTIVNAVLDYVALIAVIAIIIAGLYMIFTGGAQKDRAKEIIIYTVVGLVIILLAKLIVLTVYRFLGAQNPNLQGVAGVNVLGGTDIRASIVNVINTVLTYVGLAAIVAIVIAGLYLILGFGSDTAKDRAKNIVLYTVIGLVVILLAKLIVALPLILLK